MTTRKLMKTILKIAIILWVDITLYRSWGLKTHIRPDQTIPGAFLYDDGRGPTYCERRPFFPKFWRKLFGLPWPGGYTCPDHPSDRYCEKP
jgi:hypothetical protein